MDVVRLGILGNIVQGRSKLSMIRVTNLQQLEVGVVMVEVVILEDVVAKVIMVTSSTRVAGRLKLLDTAR